MIGVVGAAGVVGVTMIVHGAVGPMKHAILCRVSVARTATIRTATAFPGAGVGSVRTAAAMALAGTMSPASMGPAAMAMILGHGHATHKSAQRPAGKRECQRHQAKNQNSPDRLQRQ